MLNGESSQSHRLVRLETVLGKDALIATRLNATETMSQGFTFSVNAYSEKHHELQAKDLVGTMATVAIVQSDNTLRYLNGYIQELVTMGSQRAGERAAYRIVIVSWLQLLLTKQTDSRIFQEKTVTDIIKEVFSSYGGVADFSLQADAGEKWRYCTQYAESDYHFFNRICQRAGLAYYFKHENGSHKLHIVDKASKLPDLDPKSIIIQSGTGAHDHFSQWQSKTAYVTGKQAQRTYNYLKPTDYFPVDQKVSAPYSSVPRVTDTEAYVYSTQYHSTGEGKSDIARKVTQSNERGIVATGSGNCRNLLLGHHFLVELPNGAQFADKGKTFTLTQITITADDVSGTLTSSVEALPKGQLAYPKANPVTINGMQTATVTGPKGEEIHTDDLGRIKAQFHWDRLGKGDDDSSCWLRVMQSFAGPAFGAHFTPRIGQEVVVAFENGNPDRPFVIGTMYHPEHKPPYGAQKGTRSGIRTRSTKGGGQSNCNELYFEDDKGKEEVYFQAEKDHNTLIKNDETREVGNNQDSRIGNNQSIAVASNQTTEVGKNSTHSIGKELLLEAGKKITLKVGGSTIELTSSKIVVKSGTVDIDGGQVQIN
ncbi:type VI secretion system Vgr family protein [Aurantivibrio plasticivorans]